MSTKRIVLQLDVDDKKSIDKLLTSEKTLKQVNEQLQRVDKSSESFTSLSKEASKATQQVNNLKKSADFKPVEQRFNELNQTLSQGNLGLQDSQKLMREYKDLALEAGTESPIGQEAIANAAQLRGNIDEVNNSVRVTSDEFATLQGSIQIMQGMAGAAGAATGAMAVLGFESEEFEQTMQRMVGVMTVMNSLQQVSNALRADSAAMATLQAARTKALTVAQGIWNGSIGMTNILLGAKALLLKALGIGLITAAVALLVTNFDKLVGVLTKVVNLLPFVKIGKDEVTEATERQTTASERYQAQLENERTAINNTIGLLQLEIRQRRRNGEDTIELERRLLEIKINSAEREAEIFKGRITALESLGLAYGTEYEKIRLEYQALTIQAENMKEDLLDFEKDITDGISEERQKRAEQRREAEEKTLQEIEELQNLLEEREIQRNEDELERNFLFNQRKLEQQIEAIEVLSETELEKLNESERQKYDLQLQLRQEFEEELRQLEAQFEEDKLEKDIEFNERRNELLTQLGLERQELEKEQEDERLLEEFEQELERIREEEAVKLELLEEALNNKLISEAEYEAARQEIIADSEENITDVKKRNAEAQMKLDEAVRQSQIQGAMEVTQMVLAAVQEGAEEGSAIAKAAGIAMTTIETIKGAQAAFTSFANIPIVGTVLGAAAAAAVGVMGAMNIRKIAQTKSPTSGGGGGNNPSPATASTPSFTDTNLEGGEGFVDNFIEQTELQNQQSQDQRVYVVETDITDNQRNVADIEEGSDF